MAVFEIRAACLPGTEHISPYPSEPVRISTVTVAEAASVSNVITKQIHKDYKRYGRAVGVYTSHRTA